jgi:alkylation response protein AidB-like acyl-CoA dehydrogenase
MGMVQERMAGTQGGPLSPFLANVLLDEVDRELKRRAIARPLCGRRERVRSQPPSWSEKIGQRTLPTGHVRFDHVRVPTSYIVRGQDQYYASMAARTHPGPSTSPPSSSSPRREGGVRPCA